MKIRNPRTIWLLLFCIINALGFAMMSSSGFLLGDMDGFAIYNEYNLFYATMLTIFSYFIILGPIFWICAKIKTPVLTLRNSTEDAANHIGMLIFIVQIGFYIFNYINDVNIASSGNIRSESAFNLLWVFLPADTLFLIYYAIHRGNKKWFFPNLIVWMASNTSRGWVGFILAIAFFEFCRMYRNGSLTFKKAAILTAAGIALFPILNGVKWIIRGSAANTLDLSEFIYPITDAIGRDGYISLVSKGLSDIVGRIQTVSNLYTSMELGPILRSAYDSGNFIPFWKEGIFGIAYDRLFYGTKGVPLNVVFPWYAGLGNHENLGGWNVNTGFSTWFFIKPELGLFFILYVFFLCALSSILMKTISSKPSAMDGLWLAWLVFILPPWLGAFTGYIYGLIVYILIQYALTIKIRSGIST